MLYHRTLNIGRVMSPTLALIVQREAEIDTFKPIPFYTVALELPGLTAVSYTHLDVYKRQAWSLYLCSPGCSLSKRSCMKSLPLPQFCGGGGKEVDTCLLYTSRCV